MPEFHFRRSELVALNMTPRIAARARDLGYVVGPPEALPNLGVVMSRLFLPPGRHPSEAMQLLRSEGGGARFGYNSVYRSIRSANEPKVPGAAAPTPPGLQSAPAPRPEPASPALPPTATPVIPGKRCDSLRCYGPQTINWQPSLGRCASRVKVGVIDTGIDATHSTFKRRIHVGNVQQGTQPVAAAAHGTGVLAVMAGDPESGTPGLIPDAEFYAVDIFYADANGAPVSDTAHLLRALDMLEAWDVKVINMSLTGPRDDLVEEAVTRLARKNIIMVAAAGNDGPGAAPAYPAAYQDVIAVTAVNKDRRAYRQASQGSYIDVAAPGVDIWTALPGNRQGPLSGTSLATPFVASVVAGMYQSLPTKTKSAALANLQYVDLGAPGRDPVYGNGLLVAPETCQPAMTASTGPSRGPSGPSWTPLTRPASGLGLASGQ